MLHKEGKEAVQSFEDVDKRGDFQLRSQLGQVTSVGGAVIASP